MVTVIVFCFVLAMWMIPFWPNQGRHYLFNRPQKSVHDES